MIEESFYSALQDASIKALATGGIYPLEPREDKPYPQLLYRFVAGVNNPTLDTSGMFRARVQIDALAENYSDAARLRSAVVAVLDGYISPASDAVRIQNATVLNAAMDDYDKEEREFRLLAEFYLYYTL